MACLDMPGAGNHRASAQLAGSIVVYDFSCEVHCGFRIDGRSWQGCHPGGGDPVPDVAGTLCVCCYSPGQAAGIADHCQPDAADRAVGGDAAAVFDPG